MEEVKQKRNYTKRTPDERIAIREAELARMRAEKDMSPDLQAAHKAIRGLENAADKVTDSDIADTLRQYANEIRENL